MSFDYTAPGEVFDSRDVLDRMSDLRAEFMMCTEGDDPDNYVMSQDDWSVGLGDSGAAEMVALKDLENDAQKATDGWFDGATFIREDYFTEYMKDYAEGCGIIAEGSTLHKYIDWDKFADDYSSDYDEVTFAGSTYFVRS